MPGFKPTMHEFGQHKLHSGSKHGKIVTNPKQAVAIAFSEQKKMKYPGTDGPDPKGRSVAEPDVALEHRAHGHHVDEGFAKQLPKAARTPESTPKKEPNAYADPLPAAQTSGYGHAAHQRVGHLRTSGSPHAHRIGKR